MISSSQFFLIVNKNDFKSMSESNNLQSHNVKPYVIEYLIILNDNSKIGKTFP